MRSADLDRRVSVEEKTETRNSENILVTTWAEFKAIWAGKDTADARTVLKPELQQGQIDTTWKIRDVPGITYDMRINYENEIHKIRSIKEIGRGEGWFIGTVRDLPDGT